MNSPKSVTCISYLALAAVCLLGISSTSGQKTAAGSFQQQIGADGPNPNSVYGGYQVSSVSNQRQSSFAAPVQRKTQQSYVSRQQTSVVRQPQPVYQQQQISSSSTYEQQAEADAEPASYGKSTSRLLIMLMIQFNPLISCTLGRLCQRTARSRLSSLHEGA